MLDLILRQIRRHQGPLFLVLLVWLIGAYFIYQNQHRVFAYLSHLFSSPALPEKQDSAKAYPYIKRAQKRIKEEKIDLRIMEKSCRKIPIRYRGEPEQFAPDWLDRLKNWKLETVEEAKEEGSYKKVAGLPDYWKEKHAFVLLSLRDLINAMQFAYEVKAVEPKTKKRKLIIVSRLLEPYAKALCKDHLALLAWGEYLAFQERRAGGKEPKGSRLYIEALRNYLGETGSAGLGESSSPRLYSGPLTTSFCQRKRLNLSCLAPKESISTYQKLLRLEKASRIPGLHFKIAQSYLILASRESTKGAVQRRRKQALVHLRFAAKSYDWEVEAHLGMARIHLKQKKYRQALSENIRRLKNLSRRPGFPHEEFSNLARQTLIGVGRPKDADCFSTLYRKHCPELNL